MTPLDDLPPPDPKDELSLGGLAQRAKDFLLSHKWCLDIRSGYLARGWEGVLGVFLFEVTPDRADIDRRLWVVVGDVPPAYLDCDEDPPAPAEALEGYLYEMRRWTEAVRAGRSVDDLIPVCYADSRRPLEPKAEVAELLDSRLDFIERELLPELR